MGIVSKIVRSIAVKVHDQIDFMTLHPHEFQQSIFYKNIKKGTNTSFGKKYHFKEIKTYEDYKKNVPLHHYEDIRPYMERVIKGEKDVLWPGKPKYIVGTSGTTGGIKYIPLSKDSTPYHFLTARNAVLNYALKYGLLKIFDGKLLFLSGSPKLDKIGGIPTGRLSGIVNHQIPQWLKFNQIPSQKTNAIVDWEEKIYYIAKESINEKMTMISGIPPWVLMYYEEVLRQTGASSLGEVFPDFSLFVHGGVNYDPYRKKFDQLVGKQIDCLETYPSTEGFIAFQDIKGEPDMLLNVNGGVFFEFVPAHQIHDPNPDRYMLKDVQPGVEYALVINNNAGLWASILGDVIEFTQTNPYRLVFKGRIEQFISAFGEHIISRDIELAMSRCLENTDIIINEFTVGPQVNPTDGNLPYHEWVVETSNTNILELSDCAKKLDQALQDINFHYRDLRKGNVIANLKISPVPRWTFQRFLKEKGKLGGQNKIPRLRNDRKIIDQILAFANDSLCLIDDKSSKQSMAKNIN